LHQRENEIKKIGRKEVVSREARRNAKSPEWTNWGEEKTARSENRKKKAKKGVFEKPIGKADVQRSRSVEVEVQGDAPRKILGKFWKLNPTGRNTTLYPGAQHGGLAVCLVTALTERPGFKRDYSATMGSYNVTSPPRLRITYARTTQTT